ncbi:MAG: hypothetical protein IJW19_00485 [Clostridia bacterium]|nr:hypothetical protein [Clostridia bacterium]
MFIINELYEGDVNPKDSVERLNEEYIKNAVLLERKALESLDGEARKAFESYSNAMKMLARSMTRDSFAIGFETGLKLTAYSFRFET